MTSFFSTALSGNPFTTIVGSKIEKATDASLASENWALNIEICDLINESEEAGRDAMKAIRKRLTQNAGKNYNYTVVMYTLTVLETCVKNCGKKFHLLVCSKDFVQELVKLIGPKNDPPTAVQEKVLSLIQAWADAFITQPDLSGVVSVYQDLQAKGIEFPSTDLDCLAPIHTPEKSVKTKHDTVDGCLSTTTDSGMVVPPSDIPLVAVAGGGVTAAHAMAAQQMAPMPVGPQQAVVAPLVSPVLIGGPLTAEQRAKLQSELDVVQANMAVLGEMLSEIRPGAEQPDELELLDELNITCHSMQSRVVELIGKLANDEMTADLLRINDDLNNLFLRYTRFEKNREGGNTNSSTVSSPSAALGKALSSATAATSAEQEEATHSLIDWGPPEDITSKLSKLAVSGGNATAQLANVGSTAARNGPKGDTDEFDMFAQSRTVTYESTKTSGSSYKDNLEPNQIEGGLNTLISNKNKGNDLEFDEMAAWLDETPVAEESVTSSEFDRFLAERAAAADVLPPTTTATTTSITKSINSKDEKHLQLL